MNPDHGSEGARRAVDSPPPKAKEPDAAPEPSAGSGDSTVTSAARRALGAGAAASMNSLTDKPLAREVLLFGLPLVLGMFLHTTFNLVDMFIIGQLPNGTEGLAAVAICDMLAGLASIVSNGVSNAAVAVIARRAGEGDQRGIRRTAWQSLLLVTFLSLVFGLVGVLGSDFMVGDAAGAKGAVRALASSYLTVLLGGCFSIFFLLQITAILRAVGDSRSPAVLLAGGNLLNLVLAVLLVYGTGPYPASFAWAAPLAEWLHAPRLGVVGAAWATVLARTIAVIAGFVILLGRRGGPKFHVMYLRPRRQELMQLLRIGWPASSQLVVRIVTVLVFISLITRFFTSPHDNSALAAYGICLRLEVMAMFVGMGWGAAASTFVGVNLGAGNPKRALAAGWIAASYNGALMLLLVGIYFLFGEPIVAFFDPSPTVVRVGAEYLRIVGSSYFFLGFALVLSQALSGAGATLSSFILDTTMLLGLVIPASIIGVAVFHLPRNGMWYLIAGGNFLAAITYIFWYRTGTFLKKQI